MRKERKMRRKRRKIVFLAVFALLIGFIFWSCGINGEPKPDETDSGAAPPKTEEPGGSQDSPPPSVSAPNPITQQPESTDMQGEDPSEPASGQQLYKGEGDGSAGEHKASADLPGQPPQKAPEEPSGQSHKAPESSSGQEQGGADGREDPLQENKPDDSYFDDAVFIGDSLTQGFQLHGGLGNATYYAFKNLNVKDVFDKPLVKSGGGKITIANALGKRPYGKYYIMLGANELGWVYPEVFTKKYGELIELIKKESPDGKIYLQSVLPVTAEVSRTNKYYSNSRIDEYDELILALAREKGVTYLNVREAVENAEGILPDEAAMDGVHLNKKYCLKWADYLRKNKE